MKFSETLLAKMVYWRASLPSLDFANRNVLDANLQFTYHVMRASENLLACAAGRTSGELRDYYDKHLKEEWAHAEWLELDLQFASISCQEIPRESVLLAGAQYYMLFHVSPVSLLGYMAAMECFPIGLDELTQLEEVHSIKLSCLRHHAEVDPTHSQELLDIIDKMPATAHAAIMESAKQVIHFMTITSKRIEAANGPV